MSAWLPDILGFEEVWPYLLSIFLFGYALGAIPFGLLITRAAGMGDVRKIGSGNIGATNVLRTGNKGAAAATLLLDGGKGAAAALIATALYGGLAGQIAALGAFVGHLYPVWLGFRGGKGVATFLGVLLGLHSPAGIAACLTWLAMAAVMRISSLSALVAALLSPIWMYFTGYEGAIWLTIVLAVFIFWRHRENIARILAGTEPRIGRRD